MKKFCVIGNPIDHSLSPKLHNFWFKKNKIEAIYEKKLLEEKEIPKLIEKIRKSEINGVNVTVPFKNSVIPFLDALSSEAKKTNSVNTICIEEDKIIGHNTDIVGFELALRYINYEVKRKRALIIGAGGVSPSIIYALKSMGCEKIYLTNRTFEKAEKIKETFNDIFVQKWGDIPEFDIVINATSVGLKDENLDLDLNKFGNNKLYYDVIYNPIETSFLKEAKLNGNKTENGRMMFIYQAHQSFALWNKVLPKIDQESIEIIK
jgi:shikimate dehydrogenase